MTTRQLLYQGPTIEVPSPPVPPAGQSEPSGPFTQTSKTIRRPLGAEW